MVAVPQSLRYKKIVATGLALNAINFARSSAMGHRVAILVPVNYMNSFFTWSRATGEVAPTGRFNNFNFVSVLTTALTGGFADQDRVANGLSFTSSDLNSLCRDPLVTTGSCANDLVMAYLMNACFGKSSYDPTDDIYNIEDGYNMVTEAQVAEAIEDSMLAEDQKALDHTYPGLAVDQQVAGADKGAVDATFKSLLAADPLRFFNESGSQIPGLFETNYSSDPADASGNNSWQLVENDTIEIPLRLVFRAPVTVLSAQDTLRNDQDAGGSAPETVIIAGETGWEDASGVTARSVVDGVVTNAVPNKANMISIRLQLKCSTPGIPW